jgi:predicted nucleic acid-binding protein
VVGYSSGRIGNSIVSCHQRTSILIYLDTSAAFKVLTKEAERDALIDYLDNRSTETLVSSVVLRIEMHRTGRRLGVDPTLVNRVVARLALAELTQEICARAEGFADPHLRSLDAIHVATALDLGTTTFTTYDQRQAEAATVAGLIVVRPT